MLQDWVLHSDGMTCYCWPVKSANVELATRYRATLSWKMWRVEPVSCRQLQLSSNEISSSPNQCFSATTRASDIKNLLCQMPTWFNWWRHEMTMKSEATYVVSSSRGVTQTREAGSTISRVAKLLQNGTELKKVSIEMYVQGTSYRHATCV
jgi:hypothetical protein